MRKALGLMGESPRHRPEAERGDTPGRAPGGFNGGMHRRRFVQDGDVPVTVLRREPGSDVPAHRSAATVAAPSTSRLQRTEAALAAETAARERAERALAEVQATARDLQTKIGHAELAKTEAADALRHEQQALSVLRAEIVALEARAQESEARADAAEQAANDHQATLTEERNARRMLERTLRAAEAARDAAQQHVRRLSTATIIPPRDDPSRRHAIDELDVAVVRRGRPPTVITTPNEPEPEPVKWWLNPKPAATKRR